MKIAIIGSGIYGCHIASVLLDFGVDISIYEKEDSLFKWASGNNQFRLHLGYHYARDYNTRQQSKIGFDKFLLRYHDFTKTIERNLYMVPKYDSLIDFKTYLAIFRHEGFGFRLHKSNDFDFLQNVDGVVSVDERIVCVDGLKQHFFGKLGDRIHFNSPVDAEKMKKLSLDFDFVIDCTWGKLYPNDKVFYEVTHLGYMSSTTYDNNTAITLVDGELCSLYPTERSGIFTLSSVVHTPLFRSESNKECEQFITNLSSVELTENLERMKKQMSKYFPDILTHFDVSGHQLSIKSKFVGANDPRDCRIERKDNVVSVFSGKIDTISVAEEYILNILT